MAEGTVHRVELHAGDEILVSDGNWVGNLLGVPLHGGIHRAHGEVLFKFRRRDVGSGRQQSVIDEYESNGNDQKDRDDDPEDEISHRGAS